MIEKLLCKLFGHKYFVIKRFSPASRKVGCWRCHKQWGMNDRVKAFVPWDSELQEHYMEREV
ncbi:MAG: hypothetical protein KKB31_04635 [Nanoarchaeota archaeon]|nr:hypothetical protein [Nanoarchaeota archaeon]